MAEDKIQLNFTVVPDEGTGVPRVYSNFCAIQNSPFDFTLTFCEMLPLGEKQVREAQTTQTVKAPVREPPAWSGGCSRRCGRRASREAWSRRTFSKGATAGR